jgi:hypothetical protein
VNAFTHHYCQDGIYAATITLRADRVYRFRYLGKNGEWFREEAADDCEPVDSGGYNSVLYT